MSSETNPVKNLTDRLDRLTPRERGLILFALLALLLIPWYAFYLEPSQARAKAIQKSIGQQKGQVAELEAQAEAILALHRQDPDQENRRRAEQLKKELEQLHGGLGKLTLDLIPPREMPKVLEEVLTRTSTLRLVRLGKLETTPLLGSAAETAEETSGWGPNLYRHTLQMELEGSYLDTLSYLKSLEQLPRSLFWDNMEIEILRYPKARITLTVHTLSLKEGWIGV